MVSYKRGKPSCYWVLAGVLLPLCGFSVAAMQCVVAMGALVFSTSSSADWLARARSRGSDFRINYKRPAQWGKRVSELTAGRGADLIVQGGGHETLQQTTRAVAAG